MSVNFESLISTSNSEEKFLEIFVDAFSRQDKQFLEAHRIILRACYRDPQLAPTAKKAKTPEELAKVWLEKYENGYKNRISQRISQLPHTVADPIVSIIINARLAGLKTEHLKQIKYAHRLSMSAENILGLLLEEFLAEKIANYGWFFCWGESMRHVDFCNVDGSLLQVKNRSNSENSSSLRVRINQPIEKWYRVDAVNGNYQWFYWQDKYKDDNFSEEKFIAFIQQVLQRNPCALAVEVENYWKSISEQSTQTQS